MTSIASVSVGFVYGLAIGGVVGAGGYGAGAIPGGCFNPKAALDCDSWTSAWASRSSTTSSSNISLSGWLLFRGDKVSDIPRETVRARVSCSGLHMEQVGSEAKDLNRGRLARRPRSGSTPRPASSTREPAVRCSHPALAHRRRWRPGPGGAPAAVRLAGLRRARTDLRRSLRRRGGQFWCRCCPLLRAQRLAALAGRQGVRHPERDRARPSSGSHMEQVSSEAKDLIPSRLTKQAEVWLTAEASIRVCRDSVSRRSLATAT